MKKTTIASIITAGVSLCLFIVSMIFIQWDSQKADATPSVIVTSICALTCALGLFIAFAFLFKNNNKGLLFIPVAAIVVFMMVFTNGITLGNSQTNTVIDYLSPIKNNPTLLALLLTAAFVVSVILYFVKGYKWAAIVSITYITILVIIQFNYTSQIVFTGGEKTYILSTLAILAALIALIIFFLEPFITEGKKEACDCEKKEAAPAEEKVEEEKTSEAVTEEASAQEHEDELDK